MFLSMIGYIDILIDKLMKLAFKFAEELGGKFAKE